MKDMIIFTQNTMASIVATRIILNKNPNRIKTIVIANQLKGESIREQLAAAYRLIGKSSLKFFAYKLIESKCYHLLLLGHKLFQTKRFKTNEAGMIADLAKKNNIPLIKVGDLNNPEFLDRIKQQNPNYILCLIAQILKKNVFETLGNKLINAHGSFLPEYRGAAQYLFYLINDEQQFGITIHFMKPSLDSGPIIFQRKFNYDKTTSMYKLHNNISIKFGELLNEFIENYSPLKEIPSIEQEEHKATFTRMPLREDFQKLTEKGHKIITVRDFFKYI